MSLSTRQAVLVELRHTIQRAIERARSSGIDDAAIRDTIVAVQESSGLRATIDIPHPLDPFGKPIQSTSMKREDQLQKGVRRSFIITRT